MRIIVQKYFAAYNSFDIETMISLMSSDCVFESVVNGKLEFSTKGKPAYRQMCMLSKSNYKYRKQIIEGYKNGGDRVEIDLYFKATLSHDIDGLGKKDEQIAYETKSIFEIKNGLIYKITNID